MSIEVRNITKQFGAFTALDNVSLNFPTGELIALLGPSGCGKTTLLRIIAGLDTQDEGRVLLNGKDASDTHVRERHVGFVFQHYALFRHMSVFENVAFGLRVKPRRERPPEAQIRAKVNDLLELVQLGWLANRLPSQLSGGQRQRIALARALAVEPQVLLLDEPFGALDAQVRKELRRWLRRLHDELHISSLFVTHDQEEALEVADRIVLMNRGRIEQSGPTREVYEEPATSFAYGFLGATNRFDGRVEGGTISVGGYRLSPEQDVRGLPEGRSVVAFARPHELQIVPVNGSGHTRGVLAKVNRVLTFGATARVDLSAVEAGTALKAAHYEVELPRSQLASLNLQPGQAVQIVSSRLKIFEQHTDESAP